jgi:hypothetical protein
LLRALSSYFIPTLNAYCFGAVAALINPDTSKNSSASIIL